jgi:hypothetical protein
VLGSSLLYLLALRAGRALWSATVDSSGSVRPNSIAPKLSCTVAAPSRSCSVDCCLGCVSSPPSPAASSASHHRVFLPAMSPGGLVYTMLGYSAGGPRID